MSDRRSGRIVARKTLTRRYAWKVGQSDADRGIGFPIQPCRHLNRLETAGLFQFPVDPFQIFRIQSQQLCQRGDGLFLVPKPVGNDVDAEIGFILGNRLSVAINQPAAPGRDQCEIDPIAFGKQLVALVLGDRDIGHAASKQHADTDLQSTDYSRSSRKSQRLHGTADRLDWLHEATRQLSIAPMKRATNG